jgi:hypothetical protein
MTMPSNGNGRSPLVNPKVPAIPLALVYERINRQGKRYLVGRVGTAKFLIVPTGEVSRGEPVWQILLGEWPRSHEDNSALAQVENAGAR